MSCNLILFCFTFTHVVIETDVSFLQFALIQQNVSFNDLVLKSDLSF